MTARPGGDRRRVRLMSSEADRAWSLRSLCRNDFRYSDGPFGVKGDPTSFARQLAHRCRAHCPVIEQCAAEVVAQALVRPRRAVRAGVYFPDGAQPKVLDNCGCGPHCDGLPAVHRKAITR
jgi:hypothetical protein